MVIRGKCCCGTVPGPCLYLFDTFDRATVNPSGSTRYSFTPGDWETNAGRLKALADNSVIYFKHTGDPELLGGEVLVDFSVATEFKLHVGGTTVTVEKTSDLNITIDGVMFVVPSLAANPIILKWKIPALLDCQIYLSTEFPYFLDPLNTVCPAYTYPTHFLTVGFGTGNDVIQTASDEMKFQVGGSDGDFYMTPITLNGSSFTSYGFSGSTGLLLDDLEVVYQGEGQNEIQRIALSSHAFDFGVMYLTLDGVSNATAILQGSAYFDYLESNRAAIENAVASLVGYDADLNPNCEVTLDGSVYVVTFIRDMKCTDIAALHLGVDPIGGVDETVFYDEFSEPTAITVSFSTTQDGDPGCGSSIVRACHHACWPDPLPIELQLEIDGAESASVPCAVDYPTFVECMEDCDEDCNSLPYSTEGEKDARCACFEAKSECECACYAGAPVGDPPEPEPLVVCRDTCPGSNYQGLFVIPRLPGPEGESRFYVCKYGLDLPFFPYWTKESPVNGVYQCEEVAPPEPETKQGYSFRFSVALSFYDCEAQQMYATVIDESDPRLFGTVDFSMGGYALVEDFCAGATLIPSEAGFPVIFTKMNAAPTGAFCDIEWLSDDGCGEAGARDPEDPESIVCGTVNYFDCPPDAIDPDPTFVVSTGLSTP